MPAKVFDIYLREDAYIAVELLIFHGHITSFVVRLMLELESRDICVTRYDTAHGMPHRDLLSACGRLIQKDWLMDMTFANAASYAINDFKEHHETYIQQFKTRGRPSR